MSARERMEYILTGATWDEAEEVGVEILARCMALHVYARKEGEEYFSKLMKCICTRADAWAHEPGNPMILAFASLGNKIEKAGCVHNYLKEKRNEEKGRN